MSLHAMVQAGRAGPAFADCIAEAHGYNDGAEGQRPPYSKEDYTWTREPGR